MLEKLVKFEEWANLKVLAAIKDAPGNPKAQQLMSHILVAQRIWLSRLNGDDTVGTDKSPNLTMEQLESLASENHEALKRILSETSNAELNSSIEYKNLAGKEFKTPIKDIVTHVLVHGAYHRGQVAAALRANNSTPPNTDFITYVRENP